MNKYKSFKTGWELNCNTEILCMLRYLTMPYHCAEWNEMKTLLWSDLLSVIYEGVSKSFRIESITKQTTTATVTTNTRWEATQRVMASKLTRLTHKIAIQLHLVAESCTICSSRSRRPVRKLLDTPSYLIMWHSNKFMAFH
jgi:hypothetical protein